MYISLDLKKLIPTRMVDADIKLKEALREKAAHDLEAWYDQRRVAIEKKKSINRTESSIESTDSGNGASTEVSKYVSSVAIFGIPP